MSKIQSAVMKVVKGSRDINALPTSLLAKFYLEQLLIHNNVHSSAFNEVPAKSCDDLSQWFYECPWIDCANDSSYQQSQERSFVKRIDVQGRRGVNVVNVSADTTVT